MEWNDFQKLADEISEQQSKKLLAYGRRIVPTLTPEDMLQPNDYPELEHHPEFRYEEGILAGINSLKIALQALHNDIKSQSN